MNEQDNKQAPDHTAQPQQSLSTQGTENEASTKPLKKEINGPKGLEPTRYGDWESKGRCYDF